MPKIEISRSFSKKVQIKQFEPIEFFCAAKQEVDEEDTEQYSAILDDLVQKEVEKSVKNYKLPQELCESCGGAPSIGQDGKVLNEIVGGLHKECRKSEDYKKKDLL